MSTNTIKMPSAHEVNAYVTQVRAELADLSPDDVEELTGGLEADLAERVAEAPDGLAGLGSPAAYAAELRSAAGLPARSGLSPSWWSQQVAVFHDNIRDLRRDSALANEVIDFLVKLRPAWWVLRGLVIAWVGASVVGVRALLLPLGILAVVASVWLARRPKVLGEATGLLTLALNAVAIVACLGWWASYSTPGDPNAVVYGESGGPATGLVYNEQSVGNLFVYDRDGKALSDVRVFTDRGDPIDLRRDLVGDDGSPLKGPADIYGKDWSNAAPVVTSNGPFGDPTVWTPPTAIPPLAPTPEPSATATATETVDPSATTGPTDAVPSPTTTRPAPRPTMSTTAPPVPTTTR
ncbi:HAAS signaling domain-containing protein [Knoellia koreensis]|uniref:Uncharacterized protein n=1 Tax=Knoellia koreensis TaxID=2730921 RepID=A0A849HFE0_9MICO|nr:hypothetical protein [Knoellia sp. DB2414S]NNM46655.1 hypothetical protein [Knoellia sp. DB2414S]